jgi:hypothetical protein
MKNHSWPMILKFGVDVQSKQLFLITFCRICHIKRNLQKNRFFFLISRAYLIFQN